MKIYLGDGEARHALNPKTFEIPPRDARLGLRVDDYAQLIFMAPEGEGAERMWVRVSHVGGEGRYVGELDNTPSFLDLAIGSEVVFDARHVIKILLKEQRP